MNVPINENPKEALKDEIFKKTEEIDEEITKLKSELKGYEKALHKLDREGRRWFRFWMIPLGVIVLAIFGGAYLFVSSFLKYYNFAKEGVPLDILTQSSTQFTQTPGVSPSPSSSSLIIAAKLATSDDPSKGPKDAKITIVEFSDFQCPFCKEAYLVINQLLTRYSETLRLIYRDFPVDSLHPMARKAAEAAECAHVQGKFWEYHDQLFEQQDKVENDQSFYAIAKQIGLDEAKFAMCYSLGMYKQEVEEDYQTGVSAGVRGTPTWFFNGQKVEGSLSLETFEKIAQQLLK